ncbi:hypothetical protein JCM11641_006048 [Rhodosporidiobolus odoratus]
MLNSLAVTPDPTAPPLSAPAPTHQCAHTQTRAPQPPPPDLFILVRPPPSHSTHPWNLQIQLLVPSSSRGSLTGGGRRSSASSGRSGTESFGAIAGASVSRDGSVGDASASSSAAGKTRMERSSSVSSTRSSRSSRSASATSLSGMSEAGEEGGGGRRRRKVEPLLNLSFHSVLPTVVTDAATDQRVAKFLKNRGIEFTDFAIWDPVELATLSVSPFAPLPTLSSAAAPAALPSPVPTPGTGFLGRFKKLGLGGGSGSSPSAASPPAGLRGSSSSKLLASLSSSASASSADSPQPGALPLLRTPSSDAALASVSAGLDAQSSQGYAFLPRQWLRSDLASSVSGVGREGGVRIEWARPARRRSSARPLKDKVAQGNKENGPEAEEDDGEDSDPEDSDRPWVCTLVYPLSEAAPSSLTVSGLATASESRTSMSSARSRTSGVGSRDPSSKSSPPLPSSSSPPSTSACTDPPKTRKLHLATLRPAPHHPHLISTLLLPPLLPSIPLGSYSPLRGLEGGSLGPEDLRDLAMISALWVAVREGLGGLGGVGVKGDEGGKRGSGFGRGAKLKGGGKVGGLFGR